MSSFRIRPRFQYVLDSTPAQFEQLVRSKLDNPGAHCVGMVMPNYITLKIPAEERHYWSPQLSLSFEEENGKTRIWGLYGPNPPVWAIFFFGYAALAILGMFISIIGFSRMSLGLDAPILWALPVLGGLALALYLGAQTGQKIGAAQMFTLHHFWEDTIGEQVKIT